MRNDKILGLDYLRAHYRILCDGMEPKHYCTECDSIVPIEDWSLDREGVCPIPIPEKEGRTTVLVFHLAIINNFDISKAVAICNMPQA